MCQSISLCVVQVVGAHKCALRLSTGCYLIIRYRRFHNYLIVCMSMTLCVVQMAGDKVRPFMGCDLHMTYRRFHNYLNMRMSVLLYVTQVVLHRWCYTGGATGHGAPLHGLLPYIIVYIRFHQ